MGIIIIGTRFGFLVQTLPILFNQGLFLRIKPNFTSIRIQTNMRADVFIGVTTFHE
jgi:hypothetical protein